MISSVKHRQVTITIFPFELDVTYSAYSDSGRVSGPPEDCYPPEDGLDIERAEYNGEDILDLLAEATVAKLVEALWEDANDLMQDSPC